MAYHNHMGQAIRQNVGHRFHCSSVWSLSVMPARIEMGDAAQISPKKSRKAFDRARLIVRCAKVCFHQCDRRVVHDRALKFLA